MIKSGKVVGLSYLLTNSDGEELDQATRDEPFVYIHGGNQLVEGLETALNGMGIGDKKKVTVAPAQGYGELDPSLRIVVKRSMFPENVELVPGMQFQANVTDDQVRIFTIHAIDDEGVKIDGNHPLAGQTLHFDVEIISIRDATKEEMEHGHVHGPGGHHHH
jgi:FKBP-type peptidyl-prolyl cis-trans isomerase SlyD